MNWWGKFRPSLNFDVETTGGEPGWNLEHPLYSYDIDLGKESWSAVKRCYLLIFCCENAMKFTHRNSSSQSQIERFCHIMI